MKVRCLSFNYRDAKSSTKEKIALHNDELLSMAKLLKEVFHISEVFLFSTCNRTELYIVSKDDVLFCLKAWFISHRGLTLDELNDINEQCFVSEKEALSHLFLVGVGAKSQVLGDVQVVYQIKEAYKRLSVDGLIGVNLHRLLHHLFHVNKRVSNETDFHKGTSSIASAAVQLVAELVQKSTDTSILLIGAGKNGEDSLKNLISLGYSTITVVNRTKSKAAYLANKYNVRVSDFNQLSSLVEAHDVVLTSVQSPVMLLTKSTIDCDKVTYRYKYFLDLSVPSVVDSEIESNPAYLVYDMSYMKERNQNTISKRLIALTYVKSIVNEEVGSYLEWKSKYEFDGLVKAISKDVSTIQQTELVKKVKQLIIQQKDSLKQSSTSTEQLIANSLAQLKIECQRKGVYTSQLEALFIIEPYLFKNRNSEGLSSESLTIIDV